MQGPFPFEPNSKAKDSRNLPYYGRRWKILMKEALRFHHPGCSRHHIHIVRPNVEAHKFELKLVLISVVQKAQFRGTPMKDPNLHLSVLSEVCNTLKLNGVPTDAI